MVFLEWKEGKRLWSLIFGVVWLVKLSARWAREERVQGLCVNGCGG